MTIAAMTHAAHAMRARRHEGGLRPNLTRRGFTLVEMLIVLAIMAILAALTYGALFQAQHTAREAKTKATIAKLHSLLMTRWEGFHNRRLNINMSGVSTLQQLARRRLDALRDIQRMEMPDHYEDITTVPNAGLFASGYQNSLRLAYNRKLKATRTSPYEPAETLYLILTTSAGDESLTGQELNNVTVGDIDGDGMKEFHDGWGRPIFLVRWPVGFISDLQPRISSGPMIGAPDTVNHHDPFDVRRVDANAFATFPLIYSMGPDGIEDITHALTGASFNPYADLTIGRPQDLAGSGGPANGRADFHDNIHNHSLPVRQ